jgi:putative transposase
MNIDKSNIKTYSSKSFSFYEESGIIRTNENINITKDCKIHCDGRNYYILLPEERKMKKSNWNNFYCSMDPGVRKFQTLYSEDHCIKIGDNASSRIYKLLLILDKCKPKQKALKLRNKIKNLQSELHHKTSRFLCENYNQIILPRLTKNNDIIKNTKLKTKTVRNMVVLGHSKFLELLKTKAQEYTNVFVHETTEEYTSQICANCSLKTKTKKEIYKCNNCKLEIDRDLLGSRNILLKFWNLLKC